VGEKSLHRKKDSQVSVCGQLACKYLLLPGRELRF